MLTLAIMITNIKKIIESLSSNVVCGTIYKYGIYRQQQLIRMSLQDEFLCSAMIRMLTLRNYRKLNIKKLDIINIDEQEDDFIDCLVNVEINFKNSFVLSNGQKITHGNVWLSKDEILTMNNNQEISDNCTFQPKIIKYFSNVKGSLSNYIAIVDYCTNMASNPSQLMQQVESITETLINNLPLEARVYISELIKRDCCFIIKNTLNHTLNSKMILFVNNEEIGYH